MLNGCTTQLYLDEIAAQPSTAFDPAAAKAAFTKLEQLAATCDTTVAAWGSSVDGLRGITRGTVAAGESCMPPVEHLTDKAYDAAALTSCLDPSTDACLPGALTWTCEPKQDVNGPCFTDANCRDGLYCDNPQLTGLSQPCLPRKGVGETCSAGNECQSLFCKHGACVAAEQQAAYCLAN
jgi:hypothetical protein